MTEIATNCGNREKSSAFSMNGTLLAPPDRYSPSTMRRNDMDSDLTLAEHVKELRQRVCHRSIEKPFCGPYDPPGKPCVPRGGRCGIELDLPQFIEVVESFYGQVCPQCSARNSKQCPCPLNGLLSLAVEAIGTIDEGGNTAGVAAKAN
jgi:hypothetical protein